MPFSSSVFDDHIRAVVAALRPTTVCDIGPGAGKYGQIVKESCKRGGFRSHVTAIEIDRNYVEQFFLDSIYDTVIVDDAINLIRTPQIRFDLVIIGDCIEHMRKSAGIDLLNFLIYRAGYICIAYPDRYLQDDWEGHAAEAHVSTWSADDFHAWKTEHVARDGMHLFLIEGYAASVDVNWNDVFRPREGEAVSPEPKPGAELSAQGWGEVDAPHETMHDLACVRTLHAVPAAPWTARPDRAFWCEWNHAGEGSRTLQSTIDGLQAMNWPRFIPPGSTCIDIGAHSGDTAVPMGLFSFARASGARGTVVAVEPNPDVFPVLTLNLDLNAHLADFRALRAAITSTDMASVTLADHGNANCNGGILEQPVSAEVQARLRQAARVTYEARGITLASLLTKLAPAVDRRSVRFIKTDCEGYDKEIIRASGAVLDELRPALFVGWFLWFTPEDDADLFHAIEEVGYVALYPDTLLPAERTKRAMNLLCVHRSALSSVG